MQNRKNTHLIKTKGCYDMYLTNLLEEALDQNNVYYLAMLLPLVTQIAIIIFAVAVDPYFEKKHRAVMLLICILTLSLVGQNLFENELAAGEPRVFLRTLAAVYGYCVRPMILVLFLYIVKPERDYTACWVLIGINSAVYISSLFGLRISFYISGSNHYEGGPLRRFCLYLSFALLGYLLFVTVSEFKDIRKREIVIPFFNVLLILVSVLLDCSLGRQDQPISFLTIAIVSCCVSFYVWLHLQFVRKHERDLKAEQRIQIMMSQIQPHFMYNTLSTIQALCRSDPEKAFTTTERFGRYLRNNLDTLGRPDLISLEKELEHTRIYAEIEMIRFPNIKVEYDIRDKSFSLPPLTIQPLVENAIRHGVRIRKAGIVKLSTCKKDGFHEIVISDNGKGFDVDRLDAASGEESHIGIRNVRERLEKICKGTLQIESTVDIGTTVTIYIPCHRETERSK